MTPQDFIERQRAAYYDEISRELPCPKILTRKRFPLTSPFKFLLVLPLIASALVGLLAIGHSHPDPAASVEEMTPIQSIGQNNSIDPGESNESESGPRQVSLTEMLDIAQEALNATIANVDDYTARMIKHEQDRSGVLQPRSEAFIKVVTRHAGGNTGGPMKVYMRFDSPGDIQGREVIWVEDKNDGKLQIREAGMIGLMMTVSLEPTSMLAMRGQRYPITELGITRLLEKLIERGGEDVDDLGVVVVQKEGHVFDGRELTLLQIKRSRPSGREDDFSSAELVLDREKNVVVSFRSFGWPTESNPEPRLIESYEYHDLKLNVGLNDADFDTTNPDYTFKK